MHLQNDKLSNVLGLYLLGGLALAAALIMFVVKPQLAVAQVSKNKTVAVKAKIADLYKLQSDTDKLRSNYESVKADRDQILKQLPAKSEEERLMVLLTDMGQSTSNVVSTFSPGGAEPSSGSAVSVYGAGISTNTNYSNFLNFLRRIEDGARFIDIKSISLAGNTPTNLGATVNLQAYYQSSTQDTTGAAK